MRGRAKRGRTVSYSGYALFNSHSEALEAAQREGILCVVTGSEGPKLLVFLCPCGCGAIRKISVSPSVYPSWVLKIRAGKGVSLFPSVALDVECRAHFVLRDNVAYVY